MMRAIDTYAYASRLSGADPAPRAVLVLVTLAICLASTRPIVGLAAAAGMAALAVFAGGIPGRVVGRTLLAEGSFLALAVAGVALSVTSRPEPLAPWGYQIGPLWFGVGPAAIGQATLLFTRALGCTAALAFLTLTTPLVTLIDLLRRWRVPPLLIDLMTVVYRFIFVLLDTLEQMRTAQDSRLGYATRRQSMRSSALLASRLFVSSYLRSRRLYLALSSRGYDGDMRVLPQRYHAAPGVSAAGAILIAALIAVGWR